MSAFANLSPALLESLSESELADLEAELYDALDEKCGQDALYWLQNHTATENPKHAEQGLPFKSPFPKKTYFDVLYQYFASRKRLFIPKTREMMTSWCVMGWAGNRAQWHKWFVVAQTEAETKAAELITYVKQVYENQPAWLKARHPLKAEPSQTNIEWANGGRVLAIPKGEHKIRLFHPTLYVMDEAAFLPEAEQCYNAAHPVAQQIIAISSAGPGWFGNQCSR